MIKRIAKDQFHNTADGMSAAVIAIACGLHNLGVVRRARRQRNPVASFR
jgi:hypothetical protein